ncbi:MAG: hypothetical protein ACK5GN_09600 [Pseudomonadota bacterium]|jgi:hypothetical protein
MRRVPFIGKVIVGLILALNVSGCILVPFVQAFKETGLTEGDRMELLPQQLKKFSDARVFGNKSQAMALVATESQAEISKQLQDKNDLERIVKSQVDEIEWIENARKARVVIKVESFTMSQLIVKSKKEEQLWEFSAGSGWLMTRRTELGEG